MTNPAAGYQCVCVCVRACVCVHMSMRACVEWVCYCWTVFANIRFYMIKLVARLKILYSSVNVRLSDFLSTLRLLAMAVFAYCRALFVVAGDLT